MEGVKTIQYNDKKTEHEMVTYRQKVLRYVEAFRNCEQILGTAETFRVAMKWQDASEAYVSGELKFR